VLEHPLPTGDNYCKAEQEKGVDHQVIRGFVPPGVGVSDVVRYHKAYRIEDARSQIDRALVLLRGECNNDSTAVPFASAVALAVEVPSNRLIGPPRGPGEQECVSYVGNHGTGNAQSCLREVHIVGQQDAPHLLDF
jgi:hypothetical protein